MYKDLWNKTYKSICSIQHFKDDKKIASGSGFLVDGYIVTNNHVCECDSSDKVVIEFVKQDGSTVRDSQELEKHDFIAALREGSDKKIWDFAILEINHFKDFPSLELSPSENELTIGMPIGLLGYAFGENNLSIHSGIISSQFHKKDVKYIQIDASVNQGNSGGPLIDPKTGKVIGIVTRAAKGLTKMFDELISSFDNNIKALNSSKAIMKLGGIDPINVLTISQHQMKLISKEIKRSANVGIGYAFSLDKVRESLLTISANNR